MSTPAKTVVPKVKKTTDGNALRGYEDLKRWVTKFSKLYGDQASTDCSIEVSILP